jgi:Tfp pilus assembly protein PilZ
MGTLAEMEVAPPELARKAADSVLAALREGLGLLQAPENAQLAAAQDAMSLVAEALGLVRQVIESPDGAPGGAKGKTLLATSPPQVAVPAAAAAPVAPAAALKKTLLAGDVPPAAAKPAPAAPAPKPPTAAHGAPAPKPAAAAAPAAKPAAAAAPAPKPAGAAAPTAATPTPAGLDAAVRAVEAALGAHSATNFYKGLAGGDIVATGGLFIATYQVPEVGQELLLKVTMPGGYAFEAKGVVAWRRDVNPATTASGAPPGFGAQFSEISDEGRGLIQRYVRNREPLFHDDA